MAFDRAQVTKEIVQGYAEPGRSLLSPFSTRWFSPKGAPAFDMARATALAKGVLGDRRVEALLPFTDSAGQARPYKEISVVLQSVLRPLGIDLKLQQLENAALTYTEGVQSEKADASFTLTRALLDEVMARQTSFPDAVAAGKVKFTGNAMKLAELMGLMDEFPRMFEIVEPKRAVAV